MKNKGILCGVMAIFILGTGGFVYISNPINKFNNAIEENNIKKASDIYKYEIIGDSDKEAELKNTMTELVSEVKEKFLTEKISYIEASNLLNNYDKLNISNFDVSKTQGFIDTIHESRESFVSGTKHLEADNIKDAFIEFSKVNELDSNYAEAQKKISELTTKYLELTLEGVKTLTNKGLYEEAISDIKEGLSVLPGNNILENKKTEVETLLAEQQAKEEAERIEQLKNEQKVIVTKAYATDSYIYNDGYAVIKNLSNQTLKSYTVGFLMFDSNGYPVKNTYKNLYGDSNLIKGEKDSANVLSGGTTGYNFYWNIEGQATKVKACIYEAEFYDGTTWKNEYFDYWYEQEKDRY